MKLTNGSLWNQAFLARRSSLSQSFEDPFGDSPFTAVPSGNENLKVVQLDSSAMTCFPNREIVGASSCSMEVPQLPLLHTWLFNLQVVNLCCLVVVTSRNPLFNSLHRLVNNIHLDLPQSTRMMLLATFFHKQHQTLPMIGLGMGMGLGSSPGLGIDVGTYRYIISTQRYSIIMALLCLS